MSGKLECISNVRVPVVAEEPVQYEEGFDAFSQKILESAKQRDMRVRCLVPVSIFFAHTDVYTALSNKVAEVSQGALKLQAKVDISDLQVVTISFKKV